MENNEGGGNGVPRGVAMLSAVIEEAINEKRRGQLRKYDQVKQNMQQLSAQESPVKMSRFLMALRNSVSHLTKDVAELVEVALSFPWNRTEKLVAQEYMFFLDSLIAVHTFYVPLCTSILVKQFTQVKVQPFGSAVAPITTPEAQQTLYFEVCRKTHDAIRMLLETAPTACGPLGVALRQCFPHRRVPEPAQEWYVRNALFVASYAPALRRDIIGLLISEMVKIDAEIILEDDEDEDDDDDEDDNEADFDSGSDDDDNNEDQFAMDEDGQQKKNVMTVSNAMAAKLDSMLMLLFEYVSHANNRVDNFQSVLEFFEESVLPTHRCKYVQYLIFYMCSLSPGYVDAFLAVCLKRLLDKNTAIMVRQSAAAYLGSFLARAKYVSVEVTITCLNHLFEWAHHYLDIYDTSSSFEFVDVSTHCVFYSVCQTLLYVFCFHHVSLTNTFGFNNLQLWGWERLINSNLNPLKVATEPVVREFAKITRATQLCYCYTVLQRNKKVPAPDKPKQLLDSFFPFDPNFLAKSSSYVRQLHKEWEGSVIPDDVEDVEASDEEISQSFEDMSCTPDAASMLASAIPRKTFGGQSPSRGFSGVPSPSGNSFFKQW